MSHNNNAQLPAEVGATITQFVEDKVKIEKDYWAKTVADPDRAKTYVSGFEQGVRIGATEYASKLQEEREERVHLQKENDVITSNYAALQARCDRYEKALKEIAKTALVVGQPSFMWQANEALNGEGEKEVKNEP